MVHSLLGTPDNQTALSEMPFSRAYISLIEIRMSQIAPESQDPHSQPCVYGRSSSHTCISSDLPFSELAQTPIEKLTSQRDALAYSNHLHQAFCFYLDFNHGMRLPSEIRNVARMYYHLTAALHDQFKTLTKHPTSLPGELITIPAHLDRQKHIVEHLLRPPAANIEDVLKETKKLYPRIAKTTEDIVSPLSPLVNRKEELIANVYIGLFDAQKDVVSKKIGVSAENFTLTDPQHAQTWVELAERNPFARNLLWSFGAMTDTQREEVLKFSMRSNLKEEFTVALAHSFGAHHFSDCSVLNLISALHKHPLGRESTPSVMAVLLTNFHPSFPLYANFLEPVRTSILNNLINSTEDFTKKDTSGVWNLPKKESAALQYITNECLKSSSASNMADNFISLLLTQKDLRRATPSFHVLTGACEALFTLSPGTVNHVNPNGHSFAFALNERIKAAQANDTQNDATDSLFIRWTTQFGLNPHLIAPIFIPSQHIASPALIALYESELLKDSLATNKAPAPSLTKTGHRM